jgi:hypothetical protein
MLDHVQEILFVLGGFENSVRQQGAFMGYRPRNHSHFAAGCARPAWMTIWSSLSFCMARSMTRSSIASYSVTSESEKQPQPSENLYLDLTLVMNRYT